MTSPAGFCPACGAATAPADGFCSGCGVSLRAGAEAEIAAALAHPAPAPLPGAGVAPGHARARKRRAARLLPLLSGGIAGASAVAAVAVSGGVAWPGTAIPAATPAVPQTAAAPAAADAVNSAAGGDIPSDGTPLAGDPAAATPPPAAPGPEPVEPAVPAAEPASPAWGPVQRARLTPVFIRNDADDYQDVCFGPGPRPEEKVAWMEIRGRREYSDVVQCGSRHGSEYATGVMRFKLAALGIPDGAKILNVEGEFLFDESTRSQAGSAASWRVSVGSRALCATSAVLGHSGRCAASRTVRYHGGDTLDVEQSVRGARPERGVWVGVFRPVVVYRAPL